MRVHPYLDSGSRIIVKGMTEVSSLKNERRRKGEERKMEETVKDREWVIVDVKCENVQRVGDEQEKIEEIS